jgi:hypothetical protein
LEAEERERLEAGAKKKEEEKKAEQEKRPKMEKDKDEIVGYIGDQEQQAIGESLEQSTQQVGPLPRIVFKLGLEHRLGSI